MEPLKFIYSEKFFNEFTNTIQKVIPNFNKNIFLNSIYDSEWKNRELKQRMRHITLTLKEQLSSDFNVMINQVLKITDELLKTNIKTQSFEWMFFPEFIELYGLDDFEISMNAFEKMTQFTSCEFAVRPFIIKYEQLMIDKMIDWSKHKSKHVRRLSSEGCRPILPWAMALPKFKKEPKAILPILSNLKNDKSEYVRRSVANNLNDISKNQPEILIQIAKNWFDETTETDKLVKHACRTLLKAGNLEIMPLFGFGLAKNIEILAFNFQKTKIKINDSLAFTFQLKNKGNSDSLLRLEYAIYYQKANGSLSKKVFKISEKTYLKNSITNITKKQSFKIITTRKFYLGLHQVAIIVNGVSFNKHDFWLM